MLHNTGPYGPNEQPTNMGAPVNMTSVGGSMSVTPILNNLSKNTQQSQNPSSGHYNVPTYQHYSHPGLNIPPQISPFAGYSPMGFQHNFAARNVHESPWSNGALPLSLDAQSSSNIPAMNSPYGYTKKTPENFMEGNDYRKSSSPLNISQIEPKPQQTQENLRDSSYSSVLDSYKFLNNFESSNKINDQPKIQMDSTKRKSLENTVKLIETFINSTPKSRDISSTKVFKETSTITTSRNEKYEPQCDPLHIIKEQQTDTVLISPKIENSDTDDESNEPEEKQSPKAPASIETDSDSEDSSEDSKPLSNHIVKNPKPEITEDMDDMNIKTEEQNEEVVLCNPFEKDMHATRENVLNYNVVDGANSILEADYVIKNGTTIPTYFECAHCQLLFSHPKRFLIHVKWHTFGQENERRRQVAQDRLQRAQERRVARHIERLNAKEALADAEEEFKCKDCDQTFKVKSSLKNHRRKFHQTTLTRECRICHKTVVGWFALRAHLQQHSADSAAGFQCGDCPKRFKYLHSLAKHRDTHLEKTHACPECPKMFGSVALLKMHGKTHERAARGTTYRCSYCGKGFYESYNLQVHERTHRNERPFTCEICSTSFGTNSGLKRHVKVSHNAAKPFECSVCHRCFISEPIRDKHEIRLHGDPRQFKFTCEQCPCKYMTLKDLQKHIYKVHPKGRRKKKVKSEESE